MSLHYNGDESYLNVNKTEICKFKAHDNIPWYQSCSGSVPNNFIKDEMNEIVSNGTVHRANKNKDIFNIKDYLMNKHNAICLYLLKKYLLCY